LTLARETDGLPSVGVLGADRRGRQQEREGHGRGDAEERAETRARGERSAMVVLYIAGVHPADVLTLDFSDALAVLRRDQLDALFLVGGAPVPAVAAEVVANDGLALVPVRLQPVSDEAPLAAYYLPARQSVALDTPDCARSPGSPPALPGDSRSETRSSSRSKRPGPSLVARTYPWQPEPVDTVAVWSGHHHERHRGL